MYINDRELKLPHGKLLPRVKLKGVVVVLREDNKCKLQICDDSQANHNGLCEIICRENLFFSVKLQNSTQEV